MQGSLRFRVGPSSTPLAARPRPIPVHATQRLFTLRAAAADSDIEYAPEDVSTSEAATYERIAAALVAKLESIPDGETQAPMHFLLHCSMAVPLRQCSSMMELLAPPPSARGIRCR